MDCNVVLIQPQYERYEDASVYPTSPPLGLSYLAASVLEKGLTVKGYDFNVHPGEEVKILDEIINLKPRVVGISVNTPTLSFTYRIIQYLRERLVDSYFVLGGPHISSKPESVKIIGGDYGVCGDGENNFSELTKSLVNNEEIEYINKKDLISDLDSLPEPKRDLFQIEKYNFIHLISSRGCPYNCIYCSAGCSEYRRRSVNKVVDELEGINEFYNNKVIGFGDDVFTLDKDFVIELCDEIKKRNLDIKWSCTTRVDLIDDELIKLMKKTGCWHISFGVESGVEEIRKSLGKNINNDVYQRVFKSCKENGVKTRAYAIFGNPGEKVNDMKETISFLKKLKADEAFFSLMSIYPNTQLSELLIKGGLVDDSVWEKNMFNGISAPVHVPDGLTLEDMKVILTDAVKEFYLNPVDIVNQIVKARSIMDLKNSLQLGCGFIVDTLSM